MNRKLVNATPSDLDRDFPATIGLGDAFLLDADHADSAFPDSGMPQDRAARIAARRAFVEMKQLFLMAAQAVEDRKGAWLRSQVRQAHDPIDLWLLRGPLLASLRNGDEPGTRHLRAELYRRLDSTFPETFGLAHGTPLPVGGDVPEAWQIAAAGGSPFNPMRF